MGDLLDDGPTRPPRTIAGRRDDRLLMPALRAAEAFVRRHASAPGGPRAWLGGTSHRHLGVVPGLRRADGGARAAEPSPAAPTVGCDLFEHLGETLAWGTTATPVAGWRFATWSAKWVTVRVRRRPTQPRSCSPRRDVFLDVQQGTAHHEQGVTEPVQDVAQGLPLLLSRRSRSPCTGAHPECSRDRPGVHSRCSLSARPALPLTPLGGSANGSHRSPTRAPSEAHACDRLEQEAREPAAPASHDPARSSVASCAQGFERGGGRAGSSTAVTGPLQPLDGALGA